MLCSFILAQLRQGFSSGSDRSLYGPPNEYPPPIPSNAETASIADNRVGLGGLADTLTMGCIEAPVALVWFCIVFPLGLDDPKRYADGVSLKATNGVQSMAMHSSTDSSTFCRIVGLSGIAAPICLSDCNNSNVRFNCSSIRIFLSVENSIGSNPCSSTLSLQIAA